jgi:hypothetical protein
MGVRRIAAACSGLFMAVAVSCCGEPAKSPALPPPRSVEDCMNRYEQGTDNLDTCASMVGLQGCMDRYGQGKFVHTLLPFVGGGDEFDACVAKVQARWDHHAAPARGAVQRADAGMKEDAEDAVPVD